MKYLHGRFFVTGILLVLFCSISGESLGGDSYAAIHGGKNLISGGNYQGLDDDHYTSGFILGRDLHIYRKTTLSLEGDAGFPLSAGTTETGGYWKLWTVGLYGTARVGMTSVYLKLKIGLLYEKLRAETLKEFDTDDFGISGGAGLGFRLSETVFLEMEGVFLDQNIGSLRLVLGLKF